MFKIEKLILYGYENKEYTYEFQPGLNYYKGKNSSGKTEFYKFIDYMFGSSEDIRKKPWYKGSLKKATMIVTVDNITYILSRLQDPSKNYLYCADEKEEECINLREYKDKLNSIFAKDINLLKNIRNFTDEELTYRSFTMFNFLGEKRQGVIHDFFDKCSEIKYSIKLAPILNFIFNRNLEEIYELQKELNDLLEEVKGLDAKSARYDFICKQVNRNIQKLGLNSWYTGKNAKDILSNIEEIKNMQDVIKQSKEKNIADLEVMYNNICEQIKIYENSISDAKQFVKENNNRKLLLNKLDELIEENDTFSYLVNPLKKLVLDLNSTISFSQYKIKDNTILELKKQRELLKKEIKRNDSRFECYSLDEKAKSIALIEDYLSTEIHDLSNELKEKKKRIREIRGEIRILQNLDDIHKIKKISEYITELYGSAKGISSVVDDDIFQEGFKIKYLKKGNILQPMIEVTEKDENGYKQKKDENYYIGSMARHTLIQLCGYLSFLKLLLEEDKYPLIPILVIDHVSKPFDQSNSRAIGKIINTAIDGIGKDKLQIFMFDDEEYETLSLQPENFENLVSKGKSGFNPFYYAPTSENEFEISEEICSDDKDKQ